MDRTLVTKDQLNAYEELKGNIDSNFELDTNTLEVLQREKAFLNANKEWDNYQNWKTTRNPARAVLEEKFGFDTKHGSHLYRLVTEGRELLLTGNITFPRPDALLLLEIRQGRYSYEELMDLVGDIDTQFNTYYEESTLPHKPNVKEIDKLCIELVKKHLEEVSG